MSLPVFQSSTGTTPEIEVLQLKDFITRGEAPTWRVTEYNCMNTTFSDYAAAKAYFDTRPPEYDVVLVLYTRIGTLVVFHYREAEANP